MIGIVVISYNRATLLAQTVAALRSCADVGGEDTALIIADDGSDDGTHALIRGAWPMAQLVISDRKGLGANTNAGLRAAWELGCDVVLQLQDDMLLTTALPLARMADDLRRDPTLGWIRLWEIAGQTYSADLLGRYWRVRWESHDAFIASDRPHIKTRAMCRVLGDYPEGMKVVDTEPQWCAFAKQRALAHGNAPRVGIPIDFPTEDSFIHLGIASHKEAGL